MYRFIPACSPQMARIKRCCQANKEYPLVRKLLHWTALLAVVNVLMYIYMRTLGLPLWMGSNELATSAIAGSAITATIFVAYKVIWSWVLRPFLNREDAEIVGSHPPPGRIGWRRWWRRRRNPPLTFVVRF